jgi:hypothetical protein
VDDGVDVEAGKGGVTKDGETADKEKEEKPANVSAG